MGGVLRILWFGFVVAFWLVVFLVNWCDTPFVACGGVLGVGAGRCVVYDFWFGWVWRVHFLV